MGLTALLITLNPLNTEKAASIRNLYPRIVGRKQAQKEKRFTEYVEISLIKEPKDCFPRHLCTTTFKNQLIELFPHEGNVPYRCMRFVS
jgi:hypothetical protein